MGNYAYTSNPKSKNNLLQLDLSIHQNIQAKWV